MQPFNKQRFYSLRADANALGGHLESPLDKLLPTLAPTSLPAVGGLAFVRSEAFTLDGIVSCDSAYTRVSGRENSADGSATLLVTSVIEGLNILEVVRAQRVVAQLSIVIPAQPGQPIGFSTVGSSFDDLWLAGQKCRPQLNSQLQQPAGGAGLLTWQDGRRAGTPQAAAILNGLGNSKWGTTRHGWMSNPAANSRKALCSLVDSVQVAGPSRAHGHVVEIPEFGRIVLGELLVSHESVQLVGVRAELGCHVRGGITAACGGGGGTNED